MNRRIAAWTIAAVAVLGLTACSSATDAEDPSADDSAASAPADGTTEESPAEETADQSVAEACAALAAPLGEVSTSMSDLTSATDDPQATLDAFDATIEALNDAAAAVDNAEVKAVVTDLADSFGGVRDGLSKVLVEGDTSATDTLTEASNDMQAAYTDLAAICAG